MIDWLTIDVPFVHAPLEAGRITKTDITGEIEWSSPTPIDARGSFESSIRLKSLGCHSEGFADTLRIDGNPAKFLQGHNIFGSDDLLGLVSALLIKINSLVNFEAPKKLLFADPSKIVVKKIDITYSYDLGSISSVDRWIRALEFKSKSRSGRPSMKGGTIYFGKNSRRWALKFYGKGQEIKKHKLSEKIDGESLNLLTKYAETLLRCEVRLHYKQLVNDGLELLKNLAKVDLGKLFKSYLGRVDMTAQVRIPDEKLKDLPTSIRASYQLWLEGHDLRSILAKATYYRHRKLLLEHHINIDLVREERQQTLDNVVPLIHFLEAKEVALPEWAEKNQLVFDFERFKSENILRKVK